MLLILFTQQLFESKTVKNSNTSDPKLSNSHLQRFLQALDASHLIIGCAGFVLTAETFVALSLPVFYPICILVGCATVAFYGLHRLVQIRRYQSVSSSRLRMLSNYQGVMIFTITVAGLVCCFLVWSYFTHYLILLIGAGIASTFYLFPLIKNKRLRDIPYLKIWAIASMWPFITVGFPFLQHEFEYSFFIFFFIERFIFFLMITLPFDIRDRREDQLLGIKTLASVFTTSQFRYIGLALFVLSCGVIWISPFPIVYQIALQFMSLFALALLWHTSEKRPHWYFSFLLDGLIILRLALLLLLMKL